jgi:hypothetical protein
MSSIIQGWVAQLGLRHQAVLLTAVRGCDTAPKGDPSKLLVRCFRAATLVPHCGDATRAQTFIQGVGEDELRRRFGAFRKDLDHYPHHYVMHLIHSIEILGYKHPDPSVRSVWSDFYRRLCRGLHLNPETEAQLDGRLDADEETFGARDRS